MSRKRIAQLVLIVAAVALYLVLSRHWPRSQIVHIVLGDAAPRVEELTLRYAERPGPGGDLTRQVTFPYPRGTAPRIVTHEPNLPDGDYTVEVDILGAKDTRPEPFRATIERRVTLEGGTVSIDVSQAVPR
jgi:hypothetical protein